MERLLLPGFLFYVFIVSCNSIGKQVSMHVYNDTLQINESLFNSKSRVKAISNNIYFQGYKKPENRIVLIDIASSKEVFSIMPQIDYSDDVAGRFIQFDIYGLDSIFVITENNIFIINAAGKIIYNKKVNDPIVDDNGYDYRLWDNDNLFPLEYNTNSKELLIRAIGNCSFLDPGYTRRRIEVALNLTDNTIRFYSYGFPDSYRQNYFGQAVFPYRVVNGVYDIVSFPYDDSLSVFNRQTGEFKRKECRSKFQEIDFIPYDTAFSYDIERMKEHHTVLPMYPRILYDKYKNRYYRFFQKEQLLKDAKGEYRELFVKDLIIMILDNNFNVLHEENLGNAYFGYYSFVSPKGLYIWKYEKSEKNIYKDYSVFSVFNWI